MDGLERRAFSLDKVSIETRDGLKPRIVGHAALFNSRSENMGGFVEVIAPGAFSEAIQEDDVRALFNHDANYVLGRNRSGTLQLREDGQGLAIDIDPPDTQWARDLLVSIERGDISQMSFGFRVKAGGQEWTEDADGMVVRTIKKVKLYDVSPVTYPAYPATDVAVRSLEAWQAEQQPKTEESQDLWRLELNKRRLALM